MFISILIIAIGFYIALVAENMTTIFLQYFLEKRYRQRIAAATKQFEQVLMMAKSNGNGDDPDDVNVN